MTLRFAHIIKIASTRSDKNIPARADKFIVLLSARFKVPAHNIAA